MPPDVYRYSPMRTNCTEEAGPRTVRVLVDPEMTETDAPPLEAAQKTPGKYCLIVLKTEGLRLIRRFPVFGIQELFSPRNSMAPFSC